VTITAQVEDLVGVARVEWWVDGKRVSEQTAAPYLYQLSESAGKHSVYLKAWDVAGNSIQSEKISFSVAP